MNGDVKSLSGETLGQGNGGGLGKIDVEHTVAGIAIKMAVLVHVGAVTRSATFEGNLLDEPAFYQGGEAIIDRGHRNVRGALFGADKDFLGGWMIALFEENVVNLLALVRETKAARSQLLGETGNVIRDA